MKDSIKSALAYIYCQNCKLIKTNQVKGLRAKQCFDFKRMVDYLALDLEKNNIKDFEEVLSYGE